MDKSLPTQLFTVRLWQESCKEAADFRAKVQHVLSGETRYFSDPLKMVTFMLAKYQDQEEERLVLPED